MLPKRFADKENVFMVTNDCKSSYLNGYKRSHAVEVISKNFKTLWLATRDSELWIPQKILYLKKGKKLWQGLSLCLQCVPPGAEKGQWPLFLAEEGVFHLLLLVRQSLVGRWVFHHGIWIIKFSGSSINRPTFLWI